MQPLKNSYVLKQIVKISWFNRRKSAVKSLKIPKPRGNRKSRFEWGQTIKWLREKRQNITQKTKDWAKQSPLKTGDNSCSREV